MQLIKDFQSYDQISMINTLIQFKDNFMKHSLKVKDILTISIEENLKLTNQIKELRE